MAEKLEPAQQQNNDTRKTIMAKKSSKLEILLLDEKEVARKEYITAQFKVFKKAYKGVEFTEKDVAELVNMAENGDELADESADEIVAMFKTVTRDVEKSKEAAVEKQKEKDAAAKAALAEEEKKQNYELTLVELANPDADSKAYANFTSKFDLSKGLVPIEGAEVTMEDYVGAFAFGLSMENASQWIVADAAKALEDAGHENVVVQLAAKFNRAYSTISGWVRTARAFGTDKRIPSLSFTAYREIGNAKLDADEKKNAKAQEKLLKDATKNQWTAAEVRNAVNEAQGKTKDPATATPKASFLVIDAKGNPSLQVDEPAFDEKETAINIRNQTYLAVVIGEDKKERIEWTAIPVK